jgi:hypothetical protein
MCALGYITHSLVRRLGSLFDDSTEKDHRAYEPNDAFFGPVHSGIKKSDNSDDVD